MIRIAKRNHIIRKHPSTGGGVIIRKKEDFLIIRKNICAGMYPAYHMAYPMVGLINNIYSYVGDRMFSLKNCGMVTRLDGDTRGIFLYSLNDTFSNMFRRAKKIKKYMFFAWCRRCVKNSATIETGIKILRNKAYICGGKRCCKTQAETHDRRGDIYLITCSIKSGKRHQIRAHMEYANIKILGDKKYGYRNSVFVKTCFFSWVVSFLYKGRLVRFYSIPTKPFIKYYRIIKFRRRIKI